MKIMKTMKTMKMKGITLLGIALGLMSCSKDVEVQGEEILDGNYLQFTSTTEKNQEGAVLYSEWIASGFPNTSLSGAEFFDLPLIKNELLNMDKDLVIFYGKRNSVVQLPVTIPLDSESYMVELAPTTMGTIPRIRVTALQWETEPLGDIFFRPALKSKFRVIIIPGEKLFKLGSKSSADLERMSYEELASTFNIPD